MRAFLGIGGVSLVVLLFLGYLDRPGELTVQPTRQPGGGSSHGPKIEDVNAPSAENPSISFEDLINGAEFKVTDAELRDWIRDNNGSESAWLAAFGSRFSFSHNNEWLNSGLKAHPESLAMVVFAANTELLTIYANPDTARRKWLDHFLKVDPGNGLAWFMSALAEYYRGNITLGDEHWVRASRQSAFRLYSRAFEDAGYEFYRSLDVSEAVATVMGSASSPVINLPKLNDTFREVSSRVDGFRDVGLVDEADALAIASYRISIKMIELDPSDGGFLVVQLVGLGLHKEFVDQVPIEFLLAHAETEQRVELFHNRIREMRGNWSTDYLSTESDFLTWAYLRRNFGELAAVEAFAK